MKTAYILFVTLIALIQAGNTGENVHRSALLQYDKQIDEIINQMTTEEKVDMLHGKFMFVSAGIERLGITDMSYTDGPFGIREEMQPNGWANNIFIYSILELLFILLVLGNRIPN